VPKEAQLGSEVYTPPRLSGPLQMARTGWLTRDKITDVVPAKIVNFFFIESNVFLLNTALCFVGKI
jgi:hypothetical protein